MADDHGIGVRVVRPRWGGAVLVCNKCLKRHEDGKALRQALKTELKRHAEASEGRKVRLVKIACIGLCPRRAVVAASAETLMAGEVILVKDEAHVAEAVLRLVPTDASLHGEVSRPEPASGRPGRI